MDDKDISNCANIIWKLWETGEKVSRLPRDLQPSTKKDAYRIQKSIVDASGSDQMGWKIAATSQAGQRHIGVNGPLAGTILSSKVVSDGGTVDLSNNIMEVAELEFAFQMGTDLPPREQEYSKSDILNAIEFILPAIEIPDSRYDDFANVGQNHLIADSACANILLLGKPIKKDWQKVDLKNHTVSAAIDNQSSELIGIGSNVMGDPFNALVWIANELINYGDYLKKNCIITTGTCINPIVISNSNYLRADFGDYGTISVKFKN